MLTFSQPMMRQNVKNTNTLVVDMESELSGLQWQAEERESRESVKLVDAVPNEAVVEKCLGAVHVAYALRVAQIRRARDVV